MIGCVLYKQGEEGKEKVQDDRLWEGREQVGFALSAVNEQKSFHYFLEGRREEEMDGGFVLGL